MEEAENALRTSGAVPAAEQTGEQASAYAGYSTAALEPPESDSQQLHSDARTPETTDFLTMTNTDEP